MPGMNETARFISRLDASLRDDSFVRLVLSRPVTSVNVPEKVLGRLVELKEGIRVSLTMRYPTQDVTKNLTATDAVEWTRSQLGACYRSAWLGTTGRDWQWSMSEDGSCRLVGHRPSETSSPDREHDHQRERMLDDSARDWLTSLGVMSADGRVRSSMAAKWTQINRYIEIVSHLAGDAGWLRRPAGKPVVLADMGCGKGYLTFGLWHWLCRMRQAPVRIIGVETRPKLVADACALADRIGAEGLDFVAGDIATVTLPALDGLIALHACDTATDAAIRRGIELGAGLIVVAPCCHRQVRPQLGCPSPLADVLEHGLMAERMAEWVTDGLRAMILAWAGYRVKAIEFVSSEHTPKNLMLAGVRSGSGFVDGRLCDRIRQFKAFYGIQHHELDDLLERGPNFN